MNFDNDNQNLKADIGFVAAVPYHFYIFKNIIKYLPDAEFVVGEPFLWDEADNVAGERIKKLIKLIEKESLPWRFFDFKKDRNPDRNFFKKYNILVATTANGIITSPLTKPIRKVRLQYGQSKDVFEFGVWNRYFDLILAQGPHSADYFRIYARCEEIGFPKFDDWFNNNFNAVFLEELKNNLDLGKKTLLYLPTHGALSSHVKYKESLVNLRNKYNVMVKFHHDTVWHDPEQVKDYKENNFLVFEDDTDILPLLKVSDIVISDSGGAAFDAILAEKPLVIIDVSIAKEKTRQSNNIYGGVVFDDSQTYDGSIEQIIKKEEYRIGPIVNFANRLESAVAEAESDFIKFKDQRKKLRDKLFSYIDGSDGKRAAKEILKFKDAKPQSRNFFSLMLDETFFPLEKKIKYLESELGFYRNLKRLTLVEKIKFFFKNFI